MKKVLFILVLLLFSCKKNDCIKAELVKDCTGTYIRIDGKDYQVCNLEKVSAFNNGAKITVSYKKITECKGTAADQIVCLMLHANEGWIEVLKIE
ncbi:hypothetical protein [Aurantibacillus circumpalustris]|uniref:hypothetical protein n=1 Tax=Aurantibacillus circumpalustris TaxID=3036359 RepID=UPI00295AF41B|nr:hypothetical protein [Aurantibacillus circumpalustris]